VRDLTQKRIRRGSFTSVQQLVDAVSDYIRQHNANPRSFIWKAKAEDILAKVQRARAALHNTQSE
jgi:selenocysteine lyase/cysteine desulfurase